MSSAADRATAALADAAVSSTNLFATAALEPSAAAAANLLSERLALLNSGGAAEPAQQLRRHLYPEGLPRVLSSLFGDAPGLASQTETPAARRCWLDAADFCRFEEFGRLRAGGAAGAAKLVQYRFTPAEGARAEAATALIHLLRPLDPRSEEPPSECAGSLLFDEGAAGAGAGPGPGAPAAAVSSFASSASASSGRLQPLFLRRALLPPITQQLLEATSFCMPEDTRLLLRGGMCADPLLRELVERFERRFAAAPAALSGSELQRALLPPLHSDPARIARHTGDRRGLTVDSRALVLALFVHYRVSLTRRSEDLRQDPKSFVTQPIIEGTPPHLQQAWLLPERAFAQRPLALQCLDALTKSRLYNEVLYDMLGIYLPTHLVWGERGPHPESDLFLALVISGWLCRNAPYQTRLTPAHSQEYVPPVSVTAAALVPTAAAVPAFASSSASSSSAWAVSQRPSGSARFSDLDRPGRFGPFGHTASQQRVGVASGSLHRVGGGAGGSTGGAGDDAAAAAAAAAIPAPDPPVPSFATYFPPTLDLLGSVAVLLTLQMCDKDFCDVVACPDAKDATLPRGGGRSVIEHAGLAAGAATAARAAFVSREVVQQLALATAGGLYVSRRPAGPVASAGPPGQAPPPPRRPLPGTVAVPAVWSRLHAPLFHFFRNHLAQAAVGGGFEQPVVFASLVDTWCMLLAPWRARPRLKNKLLEPDSRLRVFRYNKEVGRQLVLLAEARRREARELRERLRLEQGLALGGASRRQWLQVLFNAACAAFRRTQRLEMVRLTADDVEQARRLARQSDEFGKLLRGSTDFGGALAAQMFAATLSEGEDVAAPTLADWRPWLRMHFLFYAHLLPLALRRLAQSNFAADPPVLLACLERLLDLFEPDVVAELRDCEREWRTLFPPEAQHAQTLALQALGGPAAPAAAAAAFANQPDRAVAACRIQLLAHRNLLCLPPEVHPVALVQQQGAGAGTGVGAETGLADVSAAARLVVEQLRYCLGLRGLERPLPVPLPEACEIVGLGPGLSAGGEEPLYRNLAHWHGVEVLVADVLRLAAHPIAWTTRACLRCGRGGRGAECSAAALTDAGAAACGCDACLHGRSGDDIACACGPCSWARAVAEALVSPVEAVAVRTSDLAAKIASLLAFLQGGAAKLPLPLPLRQIAAGGTAAPPGGPGAPAGAAAGAPALAARATKAEKAQLQRADQAERMMLAIDRLLLLAAPPPPTSPPAPPEAACVPSVTGFLLPESVATAPIEHCVIQDYRRRSLLARLWVHLQRVRDGLLSRGDGPPSMPYLREPSASDSELAPLPLPPGTWESSLLVALTATASRAVKAHVLVPLARHWPPLLRRVLPLPHIDETSPARNWCRQCSDVRVLAVLFAAALVAFLVGPIVFVLAIAGAAVIARGASLDDVRSVLSDVVAVTGLCWVAIYHSFLWAGAGAFVYILLLRR